MSLELFVDDCAGCQPALIDHSTGKVIPNNAPIMKAVRQFWKTTTWDERFAFHQATCLNSREPAVLKTFYSLIRRMTSALEAKA